MQLEFAHAKAIGHKLGTRLGRRIARIGSLALVAGALMLVVTARADACSDVQIADNQNYVISARTMDFDIDLRSDMQVVPRGRTVTSNAPDGKKGMTWTSRYGFVGVNALDIEKYNDGLNEKGLSVGTLWLDPSEYLKPASPETALSIHDAAAWILGNFATVDEVKAALKSVTIWGEVSIEIGIVPPLHLTIHDAQGKNLVVEFVKGEMHVYDNPNGVLTNGPAFDWQLTNLEYYRLRSSEFGSLPPTLTAPARFVQLSQLRSSLPKTASNRDAIQFAMLLMPRVSTVPGEAKAAKPNALMPFGGDYTEWTVVRDHQNRVYYYKTALNNSYRAIDLKALDFGGTQVKSISMENDGAGWVIDTTSKLK